MFKNIRNERRRIRQKRVRKQVRGSDARPRLCVSKSLRDTQVQIISDETSKVLAAASTRQIFSKSKDKSRSNVESAKALGKRIAEIAKEKNIENVVFDRNGYAYHGRVAAVAEGAREAGLKL